jgi:hypothetical protein
VSGKSLTDEDFARVLGKSSGSPEFRRLVESFNLAPQIKEFAGDRSYYAFDPIGLDFVFDQDELIAAHYAGPDMEGGAKPYPGILPRDLAFSDSRKTVIEKLGKPGKSQEAVDDPRPFVRAYPWLKYNFDGHYLHVEFLMDGSRIRMVTLGRPFA